MKGTSIFEKMIRQSGRGLTFSFPATEKLGIGRHYDYVIDSETHSIRITASDSGRYKLSRKRAGANWRPLIDLRNKEVLAAIAEMSQICIRVMDDHIIVADAKKRCRSAQKIIVLARSDLSCLRMAAGMDTTSAAERLLTGTQLTFDDYLASSRQPVSIPEVQRGLADVYTLVSLFSGAGVLDWPFAQDERFKILYAIDNDAAACETYRRNIGTHIVQGDIHKAFTEDGYPLDHVVSAPDVIIGGPPCKPFSNANRHTRLENHPDSDLVLQYMRIVEKLQPKVFAIENVPEVLTACNGAYFDAVRKTAESYGYAVAANTVQDDKVGGYTTRKRAIILGSRIGPVSFQTMGLLTGGRTAGDALRMVTSEWSNYSDVTLPGPETKRRMSFVPQGGNYRDIPAEYQTKSKNRHSCTYRRLAWDAPAPTIVNWRKPPLIHPLEDRTLTVAEAKALHGLPGDYCFCGTLGQKQQQVGNSVPVALGRYIKHAVLTLLQRGSQAVDRTFSGYRPAVSMP